VGECLGGPGKGGGGGGVETPKPPSVRHWGGGVTVREIRRPSILGTSFCGFGVVYMRTWKEVARHVREEIINHKS